MKIVRRGEFEKLEDAVICYIWRICFMCTASDMIAVTKSIHSILSGVGSYEEHAVEIRKVLDEERNRARYRKTMFNMANERLKRKLVRWKSDILDEDFDVVLLLATVLTEDELERRVGNMARSRRAKCMRMLANPLSLPKKARSHYLGSMRKWLESERARMRDNFIGMHCVKALADKLTVPKGSPPSVLLRATRIASRSVPSQVVGYITAVRRLLMEAPFSTALANKLIVSVLISERYRRNGKCRRNDWISDDMMMLSQIIQIAKQRGMN